MDLSKYNQLEQLSKDQLDELEQTLLDVVGDHFTVENIYIIGSFVFGFKKVYDIDVAVMIPESEGYCRLNEDIEDDKHYRLMERKLSKRATNRLGMKISMTPFNHKDFLTDSVKRVNPPMYDLTNRFWINKIPGQMWNYYMLRDGDYTWTVHRNSDEGRYLTQMKRLKHNKLEWTIADWDNMTYKKVKLDQFYSTEETVDEIMDAFDSTMNEIGFDTTNYTFIEPSAGDSIILDRLPKERRIGIDIDPKCEGIIESDFMHWYPDDDKQYITLGNPPFGLNGSKVTEFINHAVKFSDVIALGTPEYYEMQVKGMKLVCNKKLTSRKYRLEDETIVEVPIGIHFQIWVKLEHYPSVTN